MVRVKDKKAKGDEAFTKRKQKIGRKKLAPVTATQADVHARTLRISTSSSLAAAGGIGAAKALTAAAAADAITPGSKRPRDHDEKSLDVGLTTITAHSFQELLTGTQHYKATQRASAFASMAKLLALQAQKDAEAARLAGGGGSSADAAGRYVILPPSVPAGSASPTAPAGPLTGVNPLEKLKCFSAALEAMTDTEDHVRRAALHGLRTIIGQPDFFTAAASSSSSRGVDAGDDASAELQFEEGEWAEESPHESEDALQGTTATTTTAQLDHVVAILQAVHVSLTHALRPVRLSGVELLGLLLSTAPPAAVRAAARAVCRQQQAYLNTSATPLIGTLGMGTAGAAASTTATAASVAPTKKAVNTHDETTKAEEEWMLTLVRRVSALVLRTEHAAVLAELLDVFLNPYALLREMGSDSHSADPSTTTTAWHHPQLVKDLFDELLPKWANLWKELMEMKLQLLRQDGKLIMAAALAQCFATVLVFLKAQNAIFVRRANQDRAVAGKAQGRSSGSGRGATGSGAQLFSRQLVQYTRELLIERIPMTLAEVLRQDPVEGSGESAQPAPEGQPHKKRTSSSSSSSSQTAPSTMASTLLPTTVGETRTGAASRRAAGDGASSHKTDPRLRLALSLARVAVPLAGTDDGWKLLHHFFSVVFGYESHRAQATAAKAPYQFQSPRDLLSCVQTFHLALQLYPSSSSSTATTGAMPGAGLDDGGAASGGGAMTPQEFQHLAVLRKLIPFVPSVLQTVTRELASAVRPLSVSRGGGGGGPTDARAIEDAILLRQLALVADVMKVVTAFPLPCPTLAPGATTVADASPSGTKADQVLRLSVEQACLMLPRLLFGLRWQRREVTTTTKPTTATTTPNTTAKTSAAGAQESSEAVVRKTVLRVGVLPRSTGAVDRVVARLLRCVWCVASSGHPLLLASSSREAGTAPSFSTQWRGSLLSLYGLCTPDGQTVVAEGVLARCSPTTAAIARDALVYLGVRESDKLVVRRLDWQNGQGEWSVAQAAQGAAVSSPVPAYSIGDMLAMLPV